MAIRQVWGSQERRRERRPALRSGFPLIRAADGERVVRFPAARDYKPIGEGNTGPDREVRVPAGVTVFDAASWNGIAIDSTCGGHGTCRKCKVRVIGGSVPLSKSVRFRRHIHIAN